MVTFEQVRSQLTNIGCWPSVFGRPEKRELANILHPGERIMQASMGWYEHGTALLCATDQRLLLVDKKPMFLNVEALRYDMVAEVGYQVSIVDASIIVTYAMKNLHFRSFNISRLRMLTSYMQQRVLEFRHYHEHENAAQNNGNPLASEEYSFQEPKPQILDYDFPGSKDEVWHDYPRYTSRQGPFTSAGETAGAPGISDMPVPSLRRNPYKTTPFRRRKVGGFVTLRHFNDP